MCGCLQACRICSVLVPLLDHQDRPAICVSTCWVCRRTASRVRVVLGVLLGLARLFPAWDISCTGKAIMCARRSAPPALMHWPEGGGCKLLSGSFWVLSAAGLCVLSFLTLKLLCPCHSAGCRLLFSTCYDRQLRARWYALSVLGRVSTAVLLGLSMCVAPAATFALSMHPPVRAQAAEQDWPHRASKVQVRGSSLHTPVRCALLCTLCAVRKLVLHVSTAGLACWSLDCGRSLVCAIHTCVAGAPHILNVECSRDALSCTLF